MNQRRNNKMPQDTEKMWFFDKLGVKQDPSVIVI